MGQLLINKPEARLRLYAWSFTNPPLDYVGLVKVGQTIRADVNDRIRQSQGQAQQPYVLHTPLNCFAERPDGSIFRDHDVRQRLIAKGFENPHFGSSREWMRCTPADVLTAIAELQAGVELSGTHHESFSMRAEQTAAVEQTFTYFQDRWAEDAQAVPRFLWNAKMRFGKTFTSYQLAKRLAAKRILVATFKPAVEDAWETDLKGHQDFDGWRYISAAAGERLAEESEDAPLVCFVSLQDLLGRDKVGKIKRKNEWIHAINWDLVIFDEYHFGAWRESTRQLFADDEARIQREEAFLAADTEEQIDRANEQAAELQQPLEAEADFLQIKSRAYLYLSGTPFRQIKTAEFVDDEIFNWTYTDEQRAKAQWMGEGRNPYAALPEMRLLTYQMPPELLAIASEGEFDEFDLNSFFKATGTGPSAKFEFGDEVQKWLDIIRGQNLAQSYEALKTRESPPWPYSSGQLLPWLQHSLWFLPDVAACDAMENLLNQPHNVFWRGYKVINASGPKAGIGLAALTPVRNAIGNGEDTKTITLSCGKLTTGVTVKHWSSILMLRNLKSPETYFQAAFRVQSPWSILNPEGDNPEAELVKKPTCFVFDFAPTRALRQLTEYAIGLNPIDPQTRNPVDPEKAVADLLSFLPVLAFDGAQMTRFDVDAVLTYAMSGTTGSLLARKWDSALLVNVDNDTLKRVLANPDAMAAVARIVAWRGIGDNPLELIINKADKVKGLKKTAKDEDLSPKDKKELTKEEKEYKSLRKDIQKKLIKFATSIPAFMYLTDYRENTLYDVIRNIEPDLFRAVTGLTVADFDLLVRLQVFNTERMNAAVFAFRRYENASLRYTGIDSHEGLVQIGGWDTAQPVVAVE